MPREISEGLLGIDAQCPLGRAVQNQMAGLVKRDRECKALDLSDMDAFVNERKVHIDAAGNIVPYPGDTPSFALPQLVASPKMISLSSTRFSVSWSTPWS